MKKILLIAFMLSSGFGSIAQNMDSVRTEGGLNDVYYNLKEGDKSPVSSNDWDIALTVRSMEASVIINEGKKSGAVRCFVIANDTTSWNSIDTGGFDFEGNELWNSEETWSEGALSNLGTGHPDYGWGTYDNATHDIVGSRIFIIGDPAVKLYQVEIVRFRASGVFTFKVGDLGGTNTQYYSYNRKDTQYEGDNFVYFNFSSGTFLDLEPESEWHLLFTKYVTAIPAGPQTLYYPVTGVKINIGLEVAERTGVSAESNDTSGLQWSENITQIGYDWKSFNNTTFMYDITSDLAYFVRDKDGRIFKIYFTNYKGGTDGEFVFNVTRIDDASGVEPRSLEFSVYPNPGNGVFNLKVPFNGSYKVKIMGLDGKQVYDAYYQQGNDQIIDLSFCESGVYIVIVESENGISQSKIVLE